MIFSDVLLSIFALFVRINIKDKVIILSHQIQETLQVPYEVSLFFAMITN